MPDPIWSQLLLQVILILVNAFFAATEIAVISLNEKKIRKLSEEGDKKATNMLRMVEKPAGFLSTIQIGITLAGFMGSAFAADNFASRLSGWLINDCGVTKIPQDIINTFSVVIITLILSYFTLVFGELVPKRIAMQKSEAVANMASKVIHFLSIVAKPVIWFLSASTNTILRLCKINPNQQKEDITEEEIRLMVDIGEEKGTIETNEREMIENVFEFNNMSATDVMTHRTDMTALWVNDTPDEIIQTIEESGLSRFPVYDEDIDNIIGVVSTREYLLNSRSKNPKPMSQILRSAYLVPETVKADVLFRDMQMKKIHMAIVLDEYGGTSGLVTMEDLLEEIVGNIYDEFDPLTEQDILKIDKNLWRVSGAVDLESLEEALDIEFKDNEYTSDTVGGLVFSQLTVIPEDGSCIEVNVNHLIIKVEKLVDRRVEWVLISKIDTENISQNDCNNTEKKV